MDARKRYVVPLTVRKLCPGSRCRTLLVVLLLALPVACSFSFYYRQLEWLIPRQLNDYISVDESQRSELEKRLFQQLEWHCSTQLNAYAAWFREMSSTPHPFNRADIERNYHRSVEFWDVLMNQLSPDITALLRSASDEQVKELLENLEEHTHELEERYVTDDRKRAQQRRIARMDEILRRWIGALNREQYQALVRWSKDLGPGGDDWIESRRRWQRALGEALAMRSEGEPFARRIHTLFVEPQKLWPDSYRQEYDRLRARTIDMLAEVAAAETPGQRKYFQNQLLSWAKDFESLACHPQAVAGRPAGPDSKPAE